MTAVDETLRLVHYALLLTPACWRSSDANARLMAFVLSLALDPTFGIHSHKILDTAQPTLQALLSGTFIQTVRFSYATEGALFISAQLSSDAVSAL